MAAAVPASSVGPGPAQSARQQGLAGTRRPAASARRTPSIVINYAYLRRDLATLAVLAPTMVAVLVVAFFVLH